MQTDEHLAQQLKNGDQQALALLVERHSDALTGYLFRLSGGRRQLAEDLVQEAWLAVIKSMATYDPQRPFKLWLYGIATNLTRKHFNRADTRHTLSDDGTLMDTLPSQTNIEENTARQVMLDDVLTVINAMPEHQREVIILRYLESFSLKEIGDTLGIPVGTVKSRLSLGLRALRTLVEVQA